MKKKKDSGSISKEKKSAAKKKTAKKTRKRVKLRTFNPKKEKEIAMDFAATVQKKFNTLVKAIILFGSQTKNEAKSDSDIDIIIIVDDAGINWDLELVAWYREELAKIISASEFGQELHVNTIKITTWWNDLMHGDPVVINILRYGETLIDLGGFFKPLKALLLQGKIHATPEAVYAALQRAPMHLARSKIAEMGAIEGIYWTMVDSAQAALITLGKLPPSPEQITGMLREFFVDRGLLKKEYIRWYDEIFNLHKGIAHGKIRDVRGADIDMWQERAERFLSKMTEIIDRILEAQRKK